jgi:hypothetical protein
VELEVGQQVGLGDRAEWAGFGVAELLAVARRIMTEVLTGQVELLEDVAMPAAAAERGRRAAARGG